MVDGAMVGKPEWCRAHSGVVDHDIMFGAIQSIVLINGDNGVYCCSCF